MPNDCVLVAGAGPVGLTAAHCLARHGVPVRIIDLKEGPTTLSKALVVWRRTMQILDASIPFEEFLAAGHEARRARIMSLQKQLVEIPISDDTHGLPAGVFIPQSETERILIAALERQGVQVEWQTKLVSLSQAKDGVVCQLETPGGPEQVPCRWLVDCEGAHSVARHQLQLEFPGTSIARRWVLADIEVEQQADPHELILSNNPEGIVALFPVGATRWRVIADGGPVDVDQPRSDPSEEDIQTILDERTALGWTFSNCYWKSEFRINERQIENYVHGRILFAGDAAHVHSPAGGQGMNTGVQDATNLAWKVALVELGAAGPSLLQTYQDERHPVGATVLKVTGRMIKGAMISNPVAQHLRNALMHVGLSIPFIRRKLTGFLTEESISLSGSSLCGPGRSQAPSQPGDMFPDVAITLDGQSVPASQLLRGNQSTCIVIGEVDEAKIPDTLGGHGKGIPLTVMRIGEGTKNPHIQELAAAVGLPQSGIVLVRPDGVIAAVGNDPSIIPDYMTRLEEFA
ncbi:MAG: FAD-dependent monooxygenase [Mariniblastus sp.]|nr:FAD-dependent monooxygenase [Mariniblastus sp.]